MKSGTTTILAWGVACLMAATGLAHAGSGHPHAAADGKHVVVLGSSTAAGWGPDDPDSAWVNRFRAAAQEVDPERIVTNLAVPGYTTYHVMPTTFTPPAGRPDPDPDRNITAAMNAGPDAILINLPSNDVVNGYSVAEQLANYDTVLAIAAASNVPVWVTTAQPRNLSEMLRAELMVLRDSTYTHFGGFAVDFWTEIANPNGTISSLYDSGDGIHLNNRAHGILFERVDAKNIWGAITVGVGDVATVPSSRMYPASPNPFHRATTLSYSLAAPTHVLLDLYDVRGRKIETLEDREEGAGSYRVEVDARHLPSGVYYYRLHTATGVLVGKIVLLE